MLTPCYTILEGFGSSLRLLEASAGRWTEWIVVRRYKLNTTVDPFTCFLHLLLVIRSRRVHPQFGVRDALA